MISHAPPPSHNNAYGKRPHAHLDTEDLFRPEKAGKETLKGERYKPEGDPVLWAYPATYFNYDAQNRRGNVPRDRGGKPLGLEPAPPSDRD